MSDSPAPTRGIRPWQWGLIAVAALVSGVVAGGLLRPAPQPPGALLTAPSGTQYRAYDAIGSASGKNFELTSASGETVSLDDFEGKVLLVFFGYTHCPDICPTTLLGMQHAAAEIDKVMPEAADRFQGVFVTVDPARDTPDRLAEYVRHFDAGFAALGGDDAAIAEAAALFDVRYEAHEPDENGHYLVDHTTLGYLVGPRGRVWGIYPGAADWRGLYEGAKDLLEVDWDDVG